MNNSSRSIVRPAAIGDVETITTIFNASIVSSVASMHLQPLSVENRMNWFMQRGSRYPVLVAQLDDDVIGWAALSSWESRPGYRETAETSVYVAPDHIRQGHGGRLLEALISAAREGGMHTLVARIAIDGSGSSEKLHENFGFRRVGIMQQVGHKFGRYVDVEILQLMLDQSDSGNPLAFLNGCLIPKPNMAISPDDRGFARGVMVVEQMRTFAGEIPMLKRHLRRLDRSLKYILEDQQVVDEVINGLPSQIQRLVDHNYPLVYPGSDLRISVFVTPGRIEGNHQPTVGIATQPLPFHRWADDYVNGIRLTTATTREIPGQCIPREIKHRNRLHYYLAEQQARHRDPKSRAILLDTDGLVAEATTAAIVMFQRGQGLVAPLPNKVLPSTSWLFAQSLAESNGIPIHRRDIQLAELYQADEVLWFSTSVCVMPVTRLDGNRIGDGRPGKVFKTIIDAWSAAVGVDLIDQSAALKQVESTAEYLATFQ